MKSKKKILRIINRFNLGGPTYNAGLLTKYLSDEYETILIGGNHEESEGSSMHIVEQLGLEPVIIPEMQRSINPKNDRIAYNKIQKIIQDFKPDIVHTHASKAGALGRRAAFNAKIPQIYHTFHGHVFHSYFGNLKTNLYKNIEKRLAKKCTNIIAISELQKKELSEIHRICPAEKIKVIPLGFDLTPFYTNTEAKRKEFRSKWNIKENEIAIGIVGRIVPIKDHVFFIHVIERVLKKTTKKIRVFIVGDGEERVNIQALISKKKLSYSSNSTPALFQFTSWIKNVDEVNAGMDIICLTSRNEGTPVSLIEAQASGNPIVSTNVGGIEDVISADETGYLSDVGDLEQFTINLLKLIENEGVRNNMSNKGRERSSLYSFENLISNIKSLYDYAL
jgi:glycosyltransferase involved in cell wall biosynthesis